MKVALLQYPIVWADREQNLGLLDERLRAIQGQADMAVVPEMCTTGFCCDRPEIAEEWGGASCQALQAMADRYEIAIAGSIVCRVGEKMRNRGFLFSPHAEVQYQDKRHLYKHGGEDKLFDPGEEIHTWTYQGVKIRMLVCYDLRFPVWARQQKDDMYDLLLVVANWPEIRIQYWDALVAARATENQCYIVAVNTVGTDGMGLQYNGHSVAYDTRLGELAGLQPGEEGTRIVELDMEKLKHFREVLPLWQDGEEFEIGNRKQITENR